MEKIEFKDKSLDKNKFSREILKIGDRMIDCSVSNKLKELRKKLINN